MRLKGVTPRPPHKLEAPVNAGLWSPKTSSPFDSLETVKRAPLKTHTHTHGNKHKHKRKNTSTNTETHWFTAGCLPPFWETSEESFA